ncbi:MAG: hypothetical protein RL347_621 [Actinomycetota bacterium]
MIVLDTNVISEALSRSPNADVMAWLHHQDVSSLHMSAVSVAEISYGIALLPKGERRARLAEAWHELQMAWADRIVSVGATEAELAGVDLASRRAKGRPISLADALIAGVCISRGCILATRNTQDFVDLGLHLMDPWQADRG